MNKSATGVANGHLGRVLLGDGQGDLPMVEVVTQWSEAEIYLHGAHVTRFQRRSEPPLLFLSQCSRFEEGQPIRGGVPVIFPWFGPREGHPMHGFARIKAWELKEFVPMSDGSVSVRFRLPDCPEGEQYPPFTAEYVVTVNQGLTLELVVTNRSQDQALKFENCLHTYFEVGDSTAISIQGLKGVGYLDKVDKFAQKVESGEEIRIGSEVDRVYVNTSGVVDIVDPRLARRIRVEKSGSESTVVWNPWVAKSQAMPDFGNEEYQQMVCVESGNVGPNQLTIGPGQSARLRVRLSSEPLT